LFEDAVDINPILPCVKVVRVEHLCWDLVPPLVLDDFDDKHFKQEQILWQLEQRGVTHLLEPQTRVFCWLEQHLEFDAPTVYGIIVCVFVDLVFGIALLAHVCGNLLQDVLSLYQVDVLVCLVFELQIDEGIDVLPLSSYLLPVQLVCHHKLQEGVMFKDEP
jgi:hypothetical protein